MKKIYCDYFDQDHVLIVIWLDYKILQIMSGNFFDPTPWKKEY
jgi:hypothetical protein